MRSCDVAMFATIIIFQFKPQLCVVKLHERNFSSRSACVSRCVFVCRRLIMSPLLISDGVHLCSVLSPSLCVFCGSDWPLLLEPHHNAPRGEHAGGCHGDQLGSLECVCVSESAKHQICISPCASNIYETWCWCGGILIRCVCQSAFIIIAVLELRVMNDKCERWRLIGTLRTLECPSVACVCVCFKEISRKVVWSRYWKF